MGEPRVYKIDICELCGDQFGEGSACVNCNGHWKRRTEVVAKDAYHELALDEEYWKHQYWMLLTRLGSTLP